MAQLLPGAMRQDVRHRVSVMTAHGDYVSDVHSLSALKRVQSGSVVWREWKEGGRVEGWWPQRQNGCAREMMARREYRHWKDHLDETGCADAGMTRPLGVVFVSVSLRQDEATRVAGGMDVSASGNVTRGVCARAHGLRTHLRDRSQRDAPRSSERVGPATIKVNQLPSLQRIIVRTSQCV